ncbi:MAG: hypothetical protein ACOY3P_24550 [Planctomycetota bacterium]
MIPRCRFTVAGILLLASWAAAPLGAEEPQSLRAFYFGNSLTGATNPAWHAELGRSAGKQWEAEWWLGAGWQLWQHREELEAGRDLFGGGSKGDLTIEPELVQSAPYNAKKFYGGTWDAIVLQLFGAYLTKETDQMWSRKLSRRKDVGDLQAAADLIQLSLKRNPECRIFVYQVWAPMPAGKVPPQDQLPAWAQGKEKLRTAEFPAREGFDYAKAWLQPYDKATEKPWQGEYGPVNRTRDFSYQVFEGLKERYPELWTQGRLRMIPAGDLYLELDRAAREGRVPGVRDIRDFYTDVQHIRFGLARYTAAALFYASLFREHPGKLDWRIYGDREKYGDDPHHDGGELLPITAENAAAVNDILWGVLDRHPYAGFGGK